MCIRDSSSIGLKSYSGDGVSTISGTGRLLCMGPVSYTHLDVYKRQSPYLKKTVYSAQMEAIADELKYSNPVDKRDIEMQRAGEALSRSK